MIVSLILQVKMSILFIPLYHILILLSKFINIIIVILLFRLMVHIIVEIARLFINWHNKCVSKAWINRTRAPD